MKKILVPIILIAAGFIFYEQTKPQPNLYVTIVAVAILMFGIMQFSSKVPSKNQDKNENDVQ